MRRERICPICGGNMEQRRADEASGEECVYGKSISLSFRCDNAACGFGLAFPFDAEIYSTYLCEEIRKRTRALPADERVWALLSSLSYCKQSGGDALGDRLCERVNAIFMEALGEILRRGRELLRELAYREPNAEHRLELRRELRVFLRFLDLMEGRYPTSRLASEFEALKEALPALDHYYELGMLALSEDPASAELQFEEGVRAGGIRSRVAYVKYVLSEKAETEEERAAVKKEFSKLASESQEACYEYLRRAEIGIDPIPEVLHSYAEASYDALSNAGRIAFLRLQLTACIEFLEPTLAALRAIPIHADENGSARFLRVLSDLEELTHSVTVQCEALIASFDSLGSDADSQSDLAAERIAAEEINSLIEYAIGSAMYYRSTVEIEKRFDTAYLREAVGHFSCFLASELFAEAKDSVLDLSSLIGFRHLSLLKQSAERFRRVLAESAGLGEETL